MGYQKALLWITVFVFQASTLPAQVKIAGKIQNNLQAPLADASVLLFISVALL